MSLLYKSLTQLIMWLSELKDQNNQDGDQKKLPGSI